VADNNRHQPLILGTGDDSAAMRDRIKPLEALGDDTVPEVDRSTEL
jgi:hypothetical protein